jgi:rubredoxin-NAD+ reductase
VLPYIAPLLSCSRALAKTLAGTKTAVEYPAMPVVVKTPAHPIIVCPPPRFVPGEWKISNDENNYRALFYNTQNQLLGFVLTNAAVKERAALVKQLPPLF